MLDMTYDRLEQAEHASGYESCCGGGLGSWLTGGGMG